MSRSVDTYLHAIRNAIYGKDVRSAIANGIDQCYTDANDVVKISETQPVEENVKLWVKPTRDEYSVPTYAEFEEVADGVSDLKSTLNGYESKNYYSPSAFELGRVVNTGELVDATNRLRFPFYYPIKAGSVISVDTGYKFNAVVRDTTNTTVIDFISMGTEPYVCPYDGFFEISLGRSDDANMSVSESSHINLKIIDVERDPDAEALSTSTYRYFIRYDNTNKQLVLPAEKSANTWKYKWISCVPGEYFTIISGQGRKDARLWAFTATNTGNAIDIIEVSSANSVANNTILKVPQGASYLLIQSKTDCKYIRGVFSEIQSKEQFGYNDLNAFTAYEDGHFKTSDGSRGTSEASSYADKFRTIQYLDKRVKTVISLTSMRVFKYTAQHEFVGTVTLQNAFFFLVPDDSYLYRIDFDRVTSGGDWTETAEQIVMLTGNYDSELERVLDKETNVVPSGWFSMTAEMTEGFTYETEYQAFENALDTLVSNSHGYITKETLGTDNSGVRYIYGLTLSSPQIAGVSYGERPKVIITAGIQGSERSNIYGLFYFMKMLSENSATSPILSFIHANVELKVIPVISPWGFTNKKYWNKPTTYEYGVSLNRNFGVDGWTYSNNPDSITGLDYNYTGESAFSEPETVIVRDFLIANQDAIAVIDSHTYGDGIISDIKDMNWQNYYNRRDKYFRSLQSASKRHIQLWTGWLREKYGIGVDGSLSGRIGRVDPSSEDYKKGTLVNYATNNLNIPGVTHEGFNAFYGQEQTYTANVFKANCESLGNFVGEILRWALNN